MLLASFDSVEKAGRAVAEIIAAGIIPGGLEMMDKLAIRAPPKTSFNAGYPVDAEAFCCANSTASKRMSTTTASGFAT